MMTTNAFVTVCLLAVAGLTVVQCEVFDCSNFNPMICTKDAIIFCLTNGTIVTGRCNAQRAVCRESQETDDTFASCRSTHTTTFDCGNVNMCTKDAIPFCLNNGTIVRGSCFAKRAVCLENRKVDDLFRACNQAGTMARNDDSGNMSNHVAASFSFILLFIFTAIFH